MITTTVLSTKLSYDDDSWLRQFRGESIITTNLLCLSSILQYHQILLVLCQIM